MNRAEFRFAEVDKTVQRVTSVRKYRTTTGELVLLILKGD